MNPNSYGPSAFYMDDYYNADEWARRLRISDAEYTAYHDGKPVCHFLRTMELDIDGLHITVPPNLNLDEILKYSRIGALESFEAPDVEIIQPPDESETRELNEDPINLSEFLA